MAGFARNGLLVRRSGAGPPDADAVQCSASSQGTGRAQAPSARPAFPLQRDETSVDRHPQRLSAAQWRRAESFLPGRAGWVGVAAKDSRNFVRGLPRLYRGQASGYCVARPIGMGCPPGAGPVSYPSLRRFVVKRNWRNVGWTTVRTEDTPPGDAAAAAFGRLGIITGPETRRCRGVGHAGPESGRGHRRTGSRLGLLRRDVPAPGNRQFPCHGDAARSLASGAHRGLSGVRPAPGLHRRPGADRPPTGQAQGGKGRTSTPGSVSSGPRLQRSGPHEGRGPEVVPAVGLNMGLRHHPQEAAGGLPG